MAKKPGGFGSYKDFFEGFWLHPHKGRSYHSTSFSAFGRDCPGRQKGSRGCYKGGVRWIGALAFICFLGRAFLLGGEGDVEDIDVRDDDEDCASRMSARLALVHRVCAQDPRALTLGRSEQPYPNPLFFRTNAHHRATVCTPHKCGSESWR